MWREVAIYYNCVLINLYYFFLNIEDTSNNCSTKNPLRTRSANPTKRFHLARYHTHSGSLTQICEAHRDLSKLLYYLFIGSLFYVLYTRCFFTASIGHQPSFTMKYRFAVLEGGDFIKYFMSKRQNEMKSPCIVRFLNIDLKRACFI